MSCSAAYDDCVGRAVVEAPAVAVVDDGGNQEADQEGPDDTAEETDLGGVAGLAAGVEVEDAEAEDAVAEAFFAIEAKLEQEWW